MAEEEERVSTHKSPSRVKLTEERKRSLEKGKHTELGVRNRKEHELFSGFLTQHRNVVRPRSAVKPVLIRRQVVGKLKDYIRQRHRVESPGVDERSANKEEVFQPENEISFVKTLERGNGHINTSVSRQAVFEEKERALIREYVEPLEKEDVNQRKEVK